MNKCYSSIKVFQCFVLIIFLSACADQQAKVLKVDDQGFSIIEHRSFDYLKIRKDTIFSGYKKLKIEPLIISYAEHTQLSPPYNQEKYYQFDDLEMTQFNQRFVKAFSQRFAKSLGWELTKKEGPGVIVLKADISDLYLYASIKNNLPMRYKTVVNESSKMMIQVTFVDGMTGELLLDSYGKKFTGKQGLGVDTMLEMNSVRYWNDSYQAFSQWAKLIQQQMNPS